MKNFLFKILGFYFVPLLAIFALTEFSIRQIPNNYSFKNQWMEENSKTLKVLCLGPSSIYYGIDPKCIEIETFNGAQVSQTLNYDNFIFNKFIDDMDSLKYLILGVDYWSPFSSLEESQEWWRVKNYTIYYSCNYHKGELKYSYESYIHKYPTFSRAAKGFLTYIGLRNDSSINVNELGFGTSYTIDKRKLEWDNGEKNALRHNREIENFKRLNLIDKNLKFLDDICEKSASKGIKVVLLSSPTYKSYRAALNPEFLKEKNIFCKNFAKKYTNVAFMDYSSDVRFSDDDFYDGYHLNSVGACKFSNIIKKEILEK